MENNRSWPVRLLTVVGLLVALVVIILSFRLEPIDETSLTPEDSAVSADGTSEPFESQTADRPDGTEPAPEPTLESADEPQAPVTEAEPLRDPTEAPLAESEPDPTAVPVAESEPDTSAVVIDGGEWTVTENDVQRIRDFIELTHELDFTGPVGVRISDDIGQEYAAGFEPFSRQEWDLLQLLGLADEDAERDEANRLRLDRIRGLCCVGGDSSPFSVVMEVQPTKFATELILMHELVHALHVQNPQLYPAGRYDSAETPLTFSAAVEGVPQFVVFRYLEMASEEDRASVSADLPIIRDDMLSLIDDGPARHLNWAYDTGADFVDGVVAELGAQGLSDLLSNPPLTNEQVLFPEKYLDDEQATQVTLPVTPDGGAVTSGGTIGAGVLMWVLADQVGQEAALDLVAEWAGDSYVIYEVEQVRCLAATVMVDERSSEIGAALLAQLRVDFPDAQGEAAAGTTITFDTCGNL